MTCECFFLFCCTDNGHPATNLFGTNQKFKNAVAVINSLDTPRFTAILQRIIKKLDTKERAFTEDEEAQLMSILALSQENLQALLDSCSFIFEQCAYHGVTSELLSLQLEKAGLNAEKVVAVVVVV